MNKELFDALTELAKMKYPSVEDILRKRGFGYEADRVKKVVDEFNAYTPEDADLEAWAENEELVFEGECDGCGRSITPELPGKECHLKPKVYHVDHCWSEHLGECIEEE